MYSSLPYIFWCTTWYSAYGGRPVFLSPFQGSALIVRRSALQAAPGLYFGLVTVLVCTLWKGCMKRRYPHANLMQVEKRLKLICCAWCHFSRAAGVIIVAEGTVWIHSLAACKVVEYVMWHRTEVGAGAIGVRLVVGLVIAKGEEGFKLLGSRTPAFQAWESVLQYATRDDRMRLIGAHVTPRQV